MAMNPNWGKPKHLRVSLKSKFSAQEADARAKGRLVTQELRDKVVKAARAKATAIKESKPVMGAKVIAARAARAKATAIKESKPVMGAKVIAARAARAKATAINPKAPAIISQQVNKAKRIPYIIGGALIAVYVLFKKSRKGGRK